jgi:hypothetical protein
MKEVVEIQLMLLRHDGEDTAQDVVVLRAT